MTEPGGNTKGLDWALGGLDARVTALERGMQELQREINNQLRSVRSQNEKLDVKFDKLNDSIIASRSSWKAIVWFVGLIATVSTVAMTLHQVGVI